MYRGRAARYLPAKGPFRLRGPLGWVLNAITLAWSVLALGLYDLPLGLPVMAGSMSTFRLSCFM